MLYHLSYRPFLRTGLGEGSDLPQNNIQDHGIQRASANDPALLLRVSRGLAAVPRRNPPPRTCMATVHPVEHHIRAERDSVSVKLLIVRRNAGIQDDPEHFQVFPGRAKKLSDFDVASRIGSGRPACTRMRAAL